MKNDRSVPTIAATIVALASFSFATSTPLKASEPFASLDAGGAPPPKSLHLRSLEGVYRDHGNLVRLSHGHRVTASHVINLRGGYTIELDGAVKQGDAKVWQLEEGQLFSPDGTVLFSNGELRYVQDCLTRVAGKMVWMHAGMPHPTEPGQPISLENGTLIGDYGRMTMPNGYYSHFQDGQIFTPEGEELTAWDTVSVSGGKVTLFKDGSLLSLDSNRSMMMSDGTKVFGDGTVARRTQASHLEEVRYKIPEGATVKILRLKGPINAHRIAKGY